MTLKRHLHDEVGNENTVIEPNIGRFTKVTLPGGAVIGVRRDTISFPINFLSQEDMARQRVGLLKCLKGRSRYLSRYASRGCAIRRRARGKRF